MMEEYCFGASKEFRVETPEGRIFLRFMVLGSSNRRFGA